MLVLFASAGEGEHCPTVSFFRCYRNNFILLMKENTCVRSFKSFTHSAQLLIYIYIYILNVQKSFAWYIFASIARFFFSSSFCWPYLIWSDLTWSDPQETLRKETVKKFLHYRCSNEKGYKEWADIVEEVSEVHYEVYIYILNVVIVCTWCLFM